MSKLSKLNDIKLELQNNPSVKRFQQLEQIILNDDNLNSKFKNLLRFQKTMVNDREKGRESYKSSKEVYDIALAELTSNIIVEEYLTLLEDINNDLQMIQNIIENELNIELDK